MTNNDRATLGVAVAGFGWMGRVHTQAYARLLHHYPNLPLTPKLVAVADEVPGRAEEAAGQFGFTKPVRDWREVAADPDVAAVSIAAPNFLHREIGVAMAKAGKHIWIAAQVTPALTTVRMPCADAGATATRLLIDGIDGGATTSRVVLPTELIVRSSTGPASHGGNT